MSFATDTRATPSRYVSGPDALALRGLRGSTAVTTNASGYATLTHGLGSTPAYADISVASTDVRVAVTARTETTITIHAVNASTDAPYVGGLTVNWLVLA